VFSVVAAAVNSQRADDKAAASKRNNKNGQDPNGMDMDYIRGFMDRVIDELSRRHQMLEAQSLLKIKDAVCAVLENSLEKWSQKQG
jgi:hypothetical protein